METVFTELLKSSPGLAVAVILVLIFMKYIASKDALTNTQFDRIEAMHNKTIECMDKNTQAYGTITEAIRKCQGQK